MTICDSLQLLQPLHPADLLHITNDRGLPFHVRLVRVGEHYGRGDCLVHGETKYDRGDKSLPLVEFYDARYTDDRFGPRGQFVSRYTLDTIVKVVRAGHGINLDGGTPDWTVSAENVRVALAWVALSLATSE